MNYQKLFDYMLNEHDVTLLEGDMIEIENIVAEMARQPKSIKNNEICCDAFKEFAKAFLWMKTTEEGTLLMLYVLVNGLQMRVNYCPSCGKYVRDITIENDLF